MNVQIEPKRRAWAWPVGIAVGLGCVGVANAIMISIALSHPSTPAAEDHWAESLAWDEQLAVREASAKLGWSLTGVAWHDPGRAQLELRVVDRQGHPVTGLRGSSTLERNDTASSDSRVELVELGEGRYRTGGSIDSRGLVRLIIDVEAPSGDRYVSEQQIDLGELSLAGANTGAGATPEAS